MLVSSKIVNSISCYWYLFRKGKHSPDDLVTLEAQCFDMEHSLQTVSDCELGFVELNPTQSSTILFIHGAMASPLEASLVTPHLPGYHILIPAIHTSINKQKPRVSFTIDRVCAQLAVLIRAKAKNGQAHIYGHSLGAHIALNLAIQFPDLMPTVIASGVAVASRFPWWKRAGLPSFLYAQSVLPRQVLPKQKQIQLFNHVVQPASAEMGTTLAKEPFEGSWELCKEICASMISSLPPGTPIAIRARCLIVAGTATVGDTIDDVKYVVRAIREAGGVAEGVEIKKGGHPWIIQLPELCAELNQAWIQGSELPDGASKVETT